MRLATTSPGDLPRRRALRVEHFAGHTFQIAYVTKQLTGSDLGFYELERGIPRPTWSREAAQVRTDPS